MFNYDLHMHTEFCDHAPEQTIERILAQADALGLDTIAITEHILEPAHFKNIEKIRNEVEKFSPRCHIVIGAENDADRHFYDGRLVYEDRRQIDYVIGTIHYLPGTDILAQDDGRRPFSNAETIRRWRKMLLGLVANPAIDTLAHPGVMIANAVSADDWPRQVLDIFAEAAEISAKNHIFWELNNLTGRKLTEAQRLSYCDVLQTALDAGVELVYSSDSHNPDSIGNTSFVAGVLAKLKGAESIYNPSLLEKFK